MDFSDAPGLANSELAAHRIDATWATHVSPADAATPASHARSPRTLRRRSVGPLPGLCGLAYRPLAIVRVHCNPIGSPDAMHLMQINRRTFVRTQDSIHTPRAGICMTTPVHSRRRFIVYAALAAVAVPLVMRTSGEARSAALVKLPLDNPQAKALGYVDDASTTKNPAYKSGSTCASCQFFTAATGACTLFAGFSVSPKGWCSAWSKKAA
jgi:hypothetical protein